MTKLLGGWAVGLFILLVMCVTTFEGALAPAMWQLTGTIWMFGWWRFVERKQ